MGSRQEQFSGTREVRAAHQFDVAQHVRPNLFRLRGQKDAPVRGAMGRETGTDGYTDTDDTVKLCTRDIDHVKSVKDCGGYTFADVLRQVIDKRFGNLPNSLGRQDRMAKFKHQGRQVEEFAVGHGIAFVDQCQKNAPGTGPRVAGLRCNLAERHLPAGSVKGAQHLKPTG